MNIVPGELLDEIDVDVRALRPGGRRPGMTDVSGMTSAATVTARLRVVPGHCTTLELKQACLPLAHQRESAICVNNQKSNLGT